MDVTGWMYPVTGWMLLYGCILLLYGCYFMGVFWMDVTVCMVVLYNNGWMVVHYAPLRGPGLLACNHILLSCALKEVVCVCEGGL